MRSVISNESNGIKMLNLEYYCYYKTKWNKSKFSILINFLFNFNASTPLIPLAIIGSRTVRFLSVRFFMINSASVVDYSQRCRILSVSGHVDSIKSLKVLDVTSSLGPLPLTYHNIGFHSANMCLACNLK